MAVINIELPMLILIAALVFAAIAWTLATFTRFLRGYRYRAVFGAIAFAVSGMMGFFFMLKLATSLFGDWLAVHPVFILLSAAYMGYIVFGFLGCWTAVRVGAQMDRKHTLSVLYSLVESRKKQSGE